VGGYEIKKGAIFFLEWPPEKKGGVWREVSLSRFFLQIVHKLFVGLTFLNLFALSSAYFDMDFWTSFSLITDKIAHAEISLPHRMSTFYMLNRLYTKPQNIEMSRKKFRFLQNNYY
jgi:hypothetical protein